MPTPNGNPVVHVVGPRLRDGRRVEGFDVDARLAMQVRWRYQADLLEKAIITENQQAQDRAMAALVAIETEAMRNGVLEDLDMGDVDGATGQRIISATMAKTAVGHYAQVTGTMRHFNPVVALRMTGHTVMGDRGTFPMLNITGHEIEFDETNPKGKVKVDIDMCALGVKNIQVKNIQGGVPVGAQFETPVSQVKGQEGRPLTQAPKLTLSKAEQLKAMKKAEAGTPEGQAKQKAAKVAGSGGGTGSASAKKPKVMTLCLDGCGQETGSRFKMGHDAKLKSLLGKIEKGQVDISEVPEIAKPFVAFGKPVKVATEDGKGHTMTYPLTMAPVRFPGRDDVEYVQDLGEAFGHK